MTNIIYISYARADDINVVDTAETTLDKVALSVTRGAAPADDAPLDLTAEIENSVGRASTVVLVWSAGVLDDPLVRREIGYAIAIDRPVIVVGDMPAEALPVAVAVETVAEVSALLTDITPRNPSPETRAELYLRDFYRRVVRSITHSIIALKHASLLPLTVAPYTLDDEPADDTIQSDFPAAFAAAQHRALLLGPAGAGKTSLLLAYARDAAARRLLTPTAPLPVFGDVTRWDSRRQPHLVDWLAEESGDALTSEELNDWLATGKLFVMLDGLGEMPETSEEVINAEQDDETESHTYDPRQRFVDMLSEALMPDTLLDAGHATALKQNGMLVTCNVHDFASVGALIPLDEALCLQPVTDDALRRVFAETPNVLERLLAEENGLRALPLFANMLTHIAGDIDPYPEMIDTVFDADSDTPLDVRDRLFSHYLEARYLDEARLATQQSQPLPVDLDTLRDILGRLAVGQIINTRRENDIITPEHVKSVLNMLEITLPVEIPTEMAAQFNLMTPQDRGFGRSAYRFTHPLIRDMLAFAHALGRTLDTSYSDVIRVEAVTWLWQIVGDRAAGPLLRIASSRDDLPAVRRAAVQELGDHNYQGAVDPLLDLMDRTRDDASLRQTVARMLGYLGDSRAADVLVAVLLNKDDHLNVREAAARSLGRMAQAETIEPLISVLRDSHDQMSVRKAAAHALWPQGGQQVLNPLIETLQKRDVDTMGRILAADALGALAAPETTEALISVLQDSTDDNYVRFGVAGALQRLKTPQALDAWEAYQRGEYDAKAP